MFFVRKTIVSSSLRAGCAARGTMHWPCSRVRIFQDEHGVSSEYSPVSSPICMFQCASRPKAEGAADNRLGVREPRRLCNYAAWPHGDMQMCVQCRLQVTGGANLWPQRSRALAKRYQIDATPLSGILVQNVVFHFVQVLLVSAAPRIAIFRGCRRRRRRRRRRRSSSSSSSCSSHRRRGRHRGRGRPRGGGGDGGGGGSGRRRWWR